MKPTDTRQASVRAKNVYVVSKCDPYWGDRWPHSVYAKKADANREAKRLKNENALGRYEYGVDRVIFHA